MTNDERIDTLRLQASQLDGLSRTLENQCGNPQVTEIRFARGGLLSIARQLKDITTKLSALADDIEEK
jgi:hypothetical protein